MKSRRIFLFWALALCLICLILPALAEQSRDITHKCQITTRVGAKKLHSALDGRYDTWFSSGTDLKAAIQVTLPKGETAGGLYIKWANQSIAIRVQADTGNGYETIAQCDTPYLSDYIPLPEGVTSFRFLQDEKARGRMYIAEMRVYSRGDVPEDVQRWDMPWPKADMLVISTHPDDELLFLGGTIPYYAGEKGMAVQVAYAVPATPQRRLELLDGLWYCGVRNYPVFGRFADRFSSKAADIQKAWGKKRLDDFIVGLYREFQPEVVVTQDLNGEYGHGAHKAVADAATRAVSLAAKGSYTPKNAGDYGPWQVKKLYLHLYPENTLKMDWRVPLERFGGMSAFEVAEKAFLCHVSQQKGKYFVQDFGPYDNSVFGLYFSSVGADAYKNDFFENIDFGADY